MFTYITFLSVLLMTSVYECKATASKPQLLHVLTWFRIVNHKYRKYYEFVSISFFNSVEGEMRFSSGRDLIASSLPSY